MSRTAFLREAFKHVPQHGFTRQALSMASVDSVRLSDTAVNSLFGQGEEASKTLFRAWLDEARKDMRSAWTSTGRLSPGKHKDALFKILSHRLRYNEPVLPHLSDAFAVISSPPPLSFSPIQLSLPRFQIIPGAQHVAAVADEACWILADAGQVVASWYGQRAFVGAVYAAAELHQLSAPRRSDQFLKDLLETATKVPEAVHEVGMFADYVRRSLLGIARSRGSMF